MLPDKESSNSIKDFPNLIDNENVDVTGNSATTGSVSTSTESANQGQIKELTITGKDYSFSQSVINVKKGETVKIVLKNEQGSHDFVVDEFSISTKRVNTGKTDSVTFKADKTGSFEFYCSVGKHSEMGMKGTLVVSE